MCFNFLVCTGVLEPVEVAETQADLPDDAEQLRGPQKTENVGNSIPTGKTLSQTISKILQLISLTKSFKFTKHYIQ